MKYEKEIYYERKYILAMHNKYYIRAFIYYILFKKETIKNKERVN